MTAPFVIPLAIYLLGENAPVGFITGFPLLVVPVAQYLSRYFSRKVNDLKKLTFYTTLFDRILWVPVVFLVFVHGQLLAYMLLIVLLTARTFFASFSGTTWTLWVPGVIPSHRRASYFAFRNFIMKIFSLVGYALALGIFLGVKSEQIAFITVFLSGALIFSSISLLIMRRIDPYSIPEIEKNHENKTWTKSYLNFVTFALFWGIGYSMILPYFQLYLISPAYLGQTEIFYTFVYIVISISFITSQILWGNFASKYGNFKIIIFSSFLSIVSSGLIPLAHSTIVILLPAILYGIGQSGVTLSFFNEMLNRSDSSRINSISMYNLIQAISIGIGPILANFLIETFRFSIVAIFGTSVTVMVFALAFFMLTDLSHRERT